MVPVAAPPVSAVQPPAPDPFTDDNFPSALQPETLPKATPAQDSAVVHPEPQTHPTHAVHGSKPAPEPRNQTPEDTVRNYVESWNEGRFAAEYRTLSRTSRVLPLEEYCQRRRSLQAAQIQTQGKATRQEIGKFDSVSMDGEHAHVEITRLDRSPSGTHCFAEHFTLIQEDGEWRIMSLRQGEERRNPVTPPKGRVMKADDFAGKEKHLKRHQPVGSERE
jgi:hypothetical protein